MCKKNKNLDEIWATMEADKHLGLSLPIWYIISSSSLRLHSLVCARSGPKVIKLFSCSTHMSLKFFFLVNVKMPTIVCILKFISRIKY